MSTSCSGRRCETRLERSTELREQEADYLRGGGTVRHYRAYYRERKGYRAAIGSKSSIDADCAGPLPLLMLGPYLEIHRASIAENESNRALAALPLLRQRNEEIIRLIDSIPIIGMSPPRFKLLLHRSVSRDTVR